MDALTLAVAFAAGLVSFLSPCVLPVIPGFIAFLGGSTISGASEKRWDIFMGSVFFVLGFSFVFSVLGVLLNGALNYAAADVQLWLSRIGGVLIIFFGLVLSGLLKVPALETEHKFFMGKKYSSKHITAFVFGAAFAAGWTPCVGAVLGGILGLAASEPGSAFSLLMSYSLGLGLPFILVGLSASKASNVIKRYSKYLRYVQMVFGVFLILIGTLIFTEQLNLIANVDLLNRFLIDE